MVTLIYLIIITILAFNFGSLIIFPQLNILIFFSPFLINKKKWLRFLYDDMSQSFQFHPTNFERIRPYRHVDPHFYNLYFKFSLSN